MWRFAKPDALTGRFPFYFFSPFQGLLQALPALALHELRSTFLIVSFVCDLSSPLESLRCFISSTFLSRFFFETRTFCQLSFSLEKNCSFGIYDKVVRHNCHKNVLCALRDRFIHDVCFLGGRFTPQAPAYHYRGTRTHLFSDLSCFLLFLAYIHFLCNIFT